MKRSYLRYAVFVSPSCVLVGMPAFAQSSPSATALAALGSPLPTEQSDTIVVTAQRRGENIQRVPITIQAIDAKQIRDLGVKSSTDIGQFTSNVSISLPGGAGSQPIVTIRGVGLNDVNTNNAGPNGIYSDEVYLASPVAQTFAIFDIDRIEVLKGPQGTLYGRNTSGGAINFISAKPTDVAKGYFHAEYGSFDTAQLDGAIGGPLSETLEGRIAAVGNYSSGYMDNLLTDTRENGTKSIAGRAQLRWRPSSEFTLLLNAHGGLLQNRPTEYRHIGVLDSSTLAPCSADRINDPNGGCVDLFGYGTPKGFYDGSFNRRKDIKTWSAGSSVRAEYKPGSVTITSLTSFERSSKAQPEDTDASPDRILEVDSGVKSSAVTQELRASESGDRYNWLAGLYYLGETLKQKQSVGSLVDVDRFFGPGAGDQSPDPANPNPLTAQILANTGRQRTDSYAVFGQADYMLTDALKVTVGGRYTTEKKSFLYSSTVQNQDGGIDQYSAPIPILTDYRSRLKNNSANYKMAVDYRFTSAIMAYASVSSGFKSGGFNGGFLSTDPIQAMTQLVPIKPEKVTAYEAGVKTGFFNNRLIFNAAGFYYAYRDMQSFLITAVPGTLTVANVLSNVRRAHMAGADIDMIIKPVTNLTLSAQLGILRAQTDSDEVLSIDASGNPITAKGHHLPLAPKVSLSLASNYRIPLHSGAINLHLDSSYRSFQYFDLLNNPATTQRGYWLLNGRVAYTFHNDRWEIAAFARNITGKRYLTNKFDLSQLGFYVGVVGIPRTVGAELNFHL